MLDMQNQTGTTAPNLNQYMTNEFEANNSTSLNNSLVEFEPEPTHRNSDHLNNYPLHSIQTLSQQPQQHI